MEVNENGWVVDLELYICVFQIHANPVLSMSEERSSIVYRSTVPAIKRSPCHTKDDDLARSTNTRAFL